jgi:tetratricopeptide (TPR) repeat protein
VLVGGAQVSTDRWGGRTVSRTRTRWALPFVALALVAVRPTPVAAQAAEAPPSAADQSRDAEARALFQAGAIAFEAGRFEEALQHFQRSRELSGRPELWYNVGTVLDRLQRDAEALAAFRSYIEALPDAPNGAQVRARIAILERSVAERAQLHEAQAAREAEAAHAVAEETRASEAVLAPEDAAAAAMPEPATVTVAERAPSLVEAPEPTERRPAYKKWWVWTLVGVAIAGGVAAAVILTHDAGVAAPLSGNLAGVGGSPSQGHVTVRTLGLRLGR